MKVALETSALYTTQAGAARYVRGLLRGLREEAGVGAEFCELAWRVENFGFQQPWRAMKTAYRELVWAPWIAPRKLGAGRWELLHSTAGVLARPARGMRQVATLYDLAVLRHPERYRPWHLRAVRRRLKLLAGVDRVLCISRATADEAMGLLGLAARKLEVTYLGSDFADGGVVGAGRAPVEVLPGEFFLFVGSLEPGKNLGLLREVYGRAEAEGRGLPDLVIVGARWAGVAGEGMPPANWHYLGHQPDEVLRYLYERARALVFPSRYEGFGLPVLEAMTLDCPVVCSAVTSLPEVGGDAVLYAELEAREYLAAMRRVAGDEGLRGELIARGRVQAAKFSWRKCGAETLAVYREVLGR